ncbi:COP9 signalosome complex subunit 8 [Desmophyllum pertusum]|uniref:COP9 signalosome complex subunit 8 n=1 Tax=Desmophyllum pertusum TaxID=174260 RepID=A0A9W9ZJF8_9CNID|nr:COP9 signalosome complex subunit 8 [Desmophyllum pertusum]
MADNMAADFTERTNFDELCATCEQMELDGVASGDVYTQLLALYLFQNDTCNAKFLWKRTPEEIKVSTPELAKLWNVGCHMWKRDFVSIYNSLKQEWSPTIQPIITALQEKLQKRAFDLVSNAYTSIRADDLASLMGITTEAAVSAAVSGGWTSDPTTGMITPMRTDLPKKEIPLTSEQELALLTDYVSFLEN